MSIKQRLNRLCRAARIGDTAGPPRHHDTTGRPCNGQGGAIDLPDDGDRDADGKPLSRNLRCACGQLHGLVVYDAETGQPL